MESGLGLNGLTRLSIRSLQSVFIFLSVEIGFETLRYNYKLLEENQAIDIATDINSSECHLIFFAYFHILFICFILYMFFKSN